MADPVTLLAGTRKGAFIYRGGAARKKWRLETRFPGMRHGIVDEQDCIRKHIRCFVNGEMAAQLDHPFCSGDEVMIVAALSGG